MAALTILPLDLKGNKPSNRIVGERHTLTQVTNKPHRVLIPRMGAFYNNGTLQVTDQGRTLEPGVDYTTTYLYSELSKLATLPIYALIVILNTSVSDKVELTYQAVGGPFGLDVTELAALLEAIGEDNFRVDYEDIVNKPKAFDPEDHIDEYWQLYGAENTLTVINRVGRLAGQKDTSIIQSVQDYADHYRQLGALRLQQERDLFQQHVEDRQNPHQDNKTTVGLGHLNNWPMATTPEHSNKTLATKYAQPGGGLHAIHTGPIPALDAHVADQNNPHQIRASDVDAPFTEEQDLLLAEKLNRVDPAYNAARIFGFTPAEFKTYINKDLPASNITSGLFANGRLASGSGSTSTFLTGAGSWRSIKSLVDEYDATAVRLQIVAIRTNQAVTTASAIAYANAVFGDVNAYPVGSKAVFHGNRTHNGAGTHYEVKFLTRNSSGWASFIP